MVQSSSPDTPEEPLSPAASSGPARDAPASPTPDESSDRRMEILRAAAAVFRQKGYHGAGMREIAAKLGIAPGALYYYFSKKEDLLYACQEISLKRLNARGEELAGSSAPADARLRALILNHLDLTLDELGGSAAHVEFHALPPERLETIVAERDRYEAWIHAILEDGIEAGLFRPVDVKLTTMALLGALNWTVMWWRPEGRWTASDLCLGFTDLFVEGLKQPPEGSDAQDADPQDRDI